MEVVLRGVSLCAHPNGVKRALLHKVLEGLHSQTEEERSRLVALGEEWFTTGDKDLGEILLLRFAKDFPAQFHRHFHTAKLVQDLKDPSISPRNVALVQLIVGLQASSNDIPFSLVSTLDNLVQQELPHEVKLAVARLLLHFPSVPKTFTISNMSQIVVEWLASLSITLHDYNGSANLFTEVLLDSWQTGDSASHHMIASLLKLFQIASEWETVPSPALEIVLMHAPLQLLADATNFLTGSGIQDEVLKVTMQRMLQWPLNQNTALWVLGLLMGFIKAKKYSLLAKITYSSIFSVFRQLYIAPLQHGAFYVLEFMLLGYQHSPDAFHLIIPHLLHLLPHLKNEKEPSEKVNKKRRVEENQKHTSHSVLTTLCSVEKYPINLELETPEQDITPNLVELSSILMFHHTGYPELYIPLLHALEGHKIPGESFMRAKLSERAWLTSTASDVPMDLLPKSSTGKSGLKNLGNTCYLNSFIQSLFMSDPFRQGILTSPILPEKKVFRELQHTMAFMVYTQRRAISPRKFLDVLPQWYRSGLQQDASEFGKFLLDQLEVELKGTSLKDLVQNTFGGTFQSIIQCDHCKSESKRHESFLDLSLAFDSVEKQENSCDLSSMLNFYLSPELLKDSNQYLCESCGSLQDAVKFTSISKAPYHLMLTLNRFAYDSKTQTKTKIMQEVAYSEYITVPIMSPTTGQSIDSHYALYSVIMHSGLSAEHGHYYCYARSSDHSVQSPHDNQESTWYLMNDSSITLSSFDSLCKVTRSLTRDVAYILLYRLIDQSAPQRTGGAIPDALKNDVMEDNRAFLREQESQANKEKRDRVSVVPQFNPGSFNHRGPPPDGGAGMGMGMGGHYVC